MRLVVVLDLAAYCTYDHDHVTKFGTVEIGLTQRSRLIGGLLCCCCGSNSICCCYSSSANPHTKINERVLLCVLLPFIIINQSRSSRDPTRFYPQISENTYKNIPI